MKKWILVSVLVFFLLYIISLYNNITNKFTGTKWNFPSRIYSEPTTLYVGKKISKATLHDRIIHLEYRKINAQDSLTPGYYKETPQGFEIFLHRFQYPLELVESKPIQVLIDQNTVSSITALDTGETLANVKLEPELIASIYDDHFEDRTFVPLTEMPRNLIYAAVAIEDERFYKHQGVDPLGILRAFFVNITRMKLSQGGSTITQQLVKNYFLTSERTFKRKLNEMIMALIIDFRYSKDEILEAYLNEIYFGQRGIASISGVGSAAQFYFSKDISQLNLPECALLAGIIRSPGTYNPNKNGQKAKSRRDLVLQKMKELEFISDEEYQTAKLAPLPTKTVPRFITNAPYFIGFVRKELEKDYSIETLQSEGLKVFTTLDMHFQRAAEKSLTQNFERLEKNHPGIKQRKEKDQLNLEGAVISLQPQTGYIKAYVGGRTFQTNLFDRASSAFRQPGSTFKPFVYLTALEKNSHHLASHLQDAPLTIKYDGQSWSPQNYDKQYRGAVSFREALELSLNVPTAQLADQVGYEEIVSTLQRAGITSNLQPLPSMALGSLEVTPLELVQAFSIFPNQGMTTIARGIKQIVKADGEVLNALDIEMKKATSPEASFLIHKVLEGVVQNGTAQSLKSQKIGAPLAGKTGTTSDYKDAWFVGYSPDLLSLVWVGYDENKPTSLSGASGALPIWGQYYQKISSELATEPLSKPESIETLLIDKKTGLLFKSSCGKAPAEEYFVAGKAPSSYCDEEEGSNGKKATINSKHHR